MRFHSDSQRRAVFANMFGCKRKVDPTILRGLIESDPELTYEDLATYFDVKKSAVGHVIRLHDIPYKSKRFTVNVSRLDEAKIRGLIEKHPEYSTYALADELGYSQGGVSKIIKRLDLPYRQQRPIVVDIDNLRDLIEEHPEYNLSELASEFGVSQDAIGSFIRRHGLSYKFKREVVNTDDVERLIEDHPEYSYEDISRELGVSATGIRGVIERLDLPYELKSNKIIDVELLEQVISEHPEYTLLELAEKFDATPGGISVVLRKNDIPYTSKGLSDSDLDFAKLKELISIHPEYTQEQLGDILGVGAHIISDVIAEYKLDYEPKVDRSGSIHVDELRGIIDAHPEYTMKQLSDKVGIGEGAIASLINRYHIPYSYKMINLEYRPGVKNEIR